MAANMPFDWSKCSGVESVPGVSREWVIRGTRIPVAAVLENLEDGFTIEAVVQMFDGLTNSQVEGILAFIARQTSRE
ncbi:MAG TPA: DUF433 domain-containing protein [Candidatus Angelobacter sp.]|nr:DUF433 domain-containing protein [Candidatus Angelobacter sp.]